MEILLRFFLQLIITLLLAPLLTGVIRKLKAWSQHRKGAPVLQLYFDIAKLMHKETLRSSSASWIFSATPYILLATILFAAVFIPAVPGLFSYCFVGDALLAVYVLALGRFFMVLAGLDTGSTFGGMGSSREMMISSLMEPSLIVSIFTLGLSPLAGSTSFQAIYHASGQLGFSVFSPAYILIFVSLMLILIAETARIPVDDPSTHLELTMVHEAMLLEYSGPHLALMHLSASVKQLVIITLVVNVFLPFGAGGSGLEAIIIGLLLYIVKVLFVTIVVALIEINTVKLRLFSVPNLAALAFILALLGFMTGFIFGR